MNRHELREQAMITMYQYLLFERDIDELIADNFQEEKDIYFVSCIKNAIAKTDEYAGYINQVMKDWRFDRLGFVEQAILLLGCSEFAQKEVAAAIIIDEYVRLAKKYCDSDSYKLINSVLDII